jgi:hypothetical protein
MLGQPPHTLWGEVVLTGTTPSVFVSDVRVEILEGPSASRHMKSSRTATYNGPAGQRQNATSGPNSMTQLRNVERGLRRDLFDECRTAFNRGLTPT